MRIVGFVRAFIAGACVLACNAIIGNEASYHLSSTATGQACILTSECTKKGDVCLFAQCSPPCHEDVDCAANLRCLTTAVGTACVSSTQSKCTTDKCPTGTACSSGVCRTHCGAAGSDAGSCRTDQICSGDAVCVGTDPNHDSGSADAGGPDASKGGSGGASGGGAGGQLGTGGIVTDSSLGSGGLLGVGGTETGGTLGSGGEVDSGAACLNGKTRCSADGLQTCTAGQWGTAVACTNQTCVGTQCIGSCAVGTKQCATLVPQTCDATGTWQSGATCTGTCSGGVCQGSCTSGTKQCNGTTPQTCVAQAWQDGKACQFACTGAGVCSGVCSPGTLRCSGNSAQTCDSTGQWGGTTVCTGETCVSGVCTGICTKGATRCSSNIPQTCDGTGQWASATACPYSCSNGACTGSCVTGNKQCSNNQPQQCDANETWQNEGSCTPLAPTCSFGSCICSTVVCGGSCTDTSSDLQNCGECGHSCSLANASARSCTGSTCAPKCDAGFLNCNTPFSPTADDGCECAGTACCGSSCQTKHDDGEGDTFYDCISGTNSASAADVCSYYDTYIGEGGGCGGNCPGLICGDGLCWASDGNVYSLVHGCPSACMAEYGAASPNCAPVGTWN